MQWGDHLKELEKLRDSTHTPPQSRQRYAHGGSVSNRMKKLAAEGRGGDTKLARVGPRTAKMLDDLVHGGRVQRNPKTGLREYSGRGGSGLIPAGRGINQPQLTPQQQQQAAATQYAQFMQYIQQQGPGRGTPPPGGAPMGRGMPPVPMAPPPPGGQQMWQQQFAPPPGPPPPPLQQGFQQLQQPYGGQGGFGQQGLGGPPGGLSGNQGFGATPYQMYAQPQQPQYGGPPPPPGGQFGVQAQAQQQYPQWGAQQQAAQQQSNLFSNNFHNNHVIPQQEIRVPPGGAPGTQERIDRNNQTRRMVDASVGAAMNRQERLNTSLHAAPGEIQSQEGFYVPGTQGYEQITQNNKSTASLVHPDSEIHIVEKDPGPNPKGKVKVYRRPQNDRNFDVGAQQGQINHMFPTGFKKWKDLSYEHDPAARTIKRRYSDTPPPAWSETEQY